MLDHRLTNLVHATIAPHAPITGISFGTDDKNTWVIQFTASATAQQRTDAQGALDAFDPVAAQAGIQAEEQAELTRKEKIRLLADWLRSQTKDVREKFQDVQADIDAARTAFLTLKGRYDKLETWAKTKGYTP